MGVKDLTGATIEDTTVEDDDVSHEIVKMMKVLQIVRKPGGRIARFNLTNSKGKLFEITIDEAAAKAIHDIFENDTAARAAEMIGG